MTLLAFQLDAIDDFYTDETPALETGTRVWFMVRGAWCDGVVSESESYADTDRPFATVKELGFRRAEYNLPVDDLYSLDEMLDRDPEYNQWLHELDRADERWEERHVH